ncbi:MAG TPA: hypothetical protein VGB00_14745 [Pyrinomonadaceae bacterium]|jgi:hypothetical protein
MFQGDLINANLLSADVPEALALLLFGMSLIGATFGLRRLLKRYDEKILRQK